MRFSLRISGCRLNHAEGAAWAHRLSLAGWTFVPPDAEADLIIVHSCAVTAHAEKDSFRLVRQLRSRYPQVIVVLAGCAIETPDATKVDPAVICVTLADKDRLAELLLARFPSLPPKETKNIIVSHLSRALLKVQDGCDFFCTYCIVPHTRGAPRSKPFTQCLEEAAAFLESGYEEIVVTGCNLACYAAEGKRLPDLLEALCSLPGAGRFRLSSLEPGVIDREVVDVMVRYPGRLCAFLHLPLQSGSDAILKRMRRHYTAAQLRQQLDDICTRLPRVALGCDLITGFPGETDADFEATRRLAEDYPFSNFHVFPYSPRPGTPAAAFPGQVPPPVAKARAKQLIALAEVKRKTYMEHLVGQPLSVLIERIDSKKAYGWCGEYVMCAVPSKDAIRGKLYPFTPTAIFGDELVQ